MKKLFLSILLLCSVVERLLGADLPATLDWARRAELGTPVSGVVSEVRVRPGQSVRKGELLLRLDSGSYKARVLAAESSLEQARLNRDEAQQELDRTSELYERTLLSDHERQLAVIGLAAANANYQQAQAQLTQARNDLQYSQVRAPFDGVVVALTAEVGEPVVTNLQANTLVVVADDRQIRALAQATIDQLQGLEPEQELQVWVSGQWLEARVRYLGLEPVSRNSSDQAVYELDVIFAVPTGTRVRAGQAAMVRLND